MWLPCAEAKDEFTNLYDIACNLGWDKLHQKRTGTVLFMSCHSLAVPPGKVSLIRAGKASPETMAPIHLSTIGRGWAGLKGCC